MPKFDFTKLSAAIRERFRYRLVLWAVLAIALAAGLAVMVRSGVRAADARREASGDKAPIQAVPSPVLRVKVERNPEREAYFGETHVHTSWSFDAYVFGNTKAGPEDAYKYAMGETIDHPAGYKIKITRPLDFMAVTDHAEYIGVVPLANDPNSPISKLPIAEKLKVRSKDDILRVYMFLGTSLIKSEPIHELTAPRLRVASGRTLSQSQTSIISRESSQPSPPMNGLPRPTIATCTATSSLKILKKYREFPFLPWTQIIPRISGTG